MPQRPEINLSPASVAQTDALLDKLRRDAELLCVNYVEAPANYATGDHLHPRTMHLTCAVAGRGYCCLEGRQDIIEPGGMHVVYPGVVHRFQSDATDPYSKYVIKLRIKGMAPRALPDWIPFGRRRRSVEALLRRLGKRFQRTPRTGSWEFRVGSSLLELIAELIELAAAVPPGAPAARALQARDPFAELLDKLQSAPFRYPGIEAMSARANLSRRAFTERFRRITGASPFQFFQQVRLSYARQMMASGDFLLKEVAYECGFANSQNLLRALNRMPH